MPKMYKRGYFKGVVFMTLFSKKEYRDEVFKLQSQVPADIRAQWDKIILDKLINSDYYKNSSVIFTFVSFRDEVDTHSFIEYALKDGKSICVPKVPSKKQGMEVYVINSLEDLKEGYFGILEPMSHCTKVLPEDIDFIVMPGVAFDREGGRVGYGAGFYDRFLAGLTKQVPKIALAYELQLYEKVPTDEFDIKIDGIITNEDSIIF